MKNRRVSLKSNARRKQQQKKAHCKIVNRRKMFANWFMDDLTEA